MAKIEILPELPLPNDRAIMIKGKRAKRPRPSSSGGDSLICSSIQTEEDEVDMANCLILLARGNTPPAPKTEIGIDVYDCKTCNRAFRSFQALGGHRASHKRPKLAADTDRKKSHDHDREEGVRVSGNKLNNTKIHECSVCGSVFASGQALGGHMRRHRAAPNPTANDAASSHVVVIIGDKPRSVLALDLDLNLPAPTEVDEKCNQQRRRMVFSAAALVDCHY